MNDDLHPSDTPSEQLLAVNAVLDGIATDDQRALVDASAQLTQLLDELQTNRQAVAQVEASPDQTSTETRELHIAAALAAFDELHRADADAVATVAARPAAKVVSLDRHRRMYRTLMGAAAALVVLVGGVAALGSLGGSDDDSAATATETRKADGDQAATLDAPAPELADTGAGSTDAPATQSAEAVTAMTENSSATVETEVLEDAAGDTNAPAETAEAPRPTIGSIGVGGADTAQRIANEDELAAYVASPPATDNETTSAPCVPSGSDNLGNITYQGTLAVVVRDPDTGQVDVFDVDDCTLLVTLPA